MASFVTSKRVFANGMFSIAAFALIGCDPKSTPNPRAAVAYEIPTNTSLPSPVLTPSNEPVVSIHRDVRSVRFGKRPPADFTVVYPDGRILWRHGEQALEGRIDTALVESFLLDLHRESVFGDGRVAVKKFGPDSIYDVIIVKTMDREIVLGSWHEVAEERGTAIGTAHGLEAREGRDPKDVLEKQPESYRRFRKLWSEIRDRVESWVPATGTAYTGPMPEWK